MPRSFAQLESEARQLGRTRGEAAGSWVIDGNTSEATARKILKGYEDGDPEIMDLEPSPLSGEWAGDPTSNSLHEELGAQHLNPDEQSDLDSAYEEAFSLGFWDEVHRSARSAAGMSMGKGKRG